MKVRELIQLLSTLPPDAEIGIEHNLEIAPGLFRGDSNTGAGFRYGVCATRESIERARKSEPTVYRLRAECATDVERLTVLLKPNLVRIETLQKGKFPDVIADIEVLGLSLVEMRKLCKQVPDGHVMAETVARKEDYTGNRAEVP